MAQQMTVALVRAPHYANGMTTNSAVAREHAYRQIDAMTFAPDDSDIVWTMSQHGCLTDPEDPAWTQECRERMRDAVDVVLDSEEVAEVTLDGVVWLVTGGMTGGDEPTDAYRSVCTVADLAVFDAPIPRPADERVSLTSDEREVVLDLLVSVGAHLTLDTDWSNRFPDEASARRHSVRRALYGRLTRA